jgi:hypothetical protein
MFIFCLSELLDPALSSNGTHPNSIPAALNGSTHPSILFYLFISSDFVSIFN